MGVDFPFLSDVVDNLCGGASFGARRDEVAVFDI